MQLKNLVVCVENPEDKRFIFKAIQNILGFSNNFSKDIVNSSECIVFRIGKNERL